MIILDNFLPEHYQNQIEQTILDESFPWYYNMVTAEINNKYACCIDEKTRDVTQFTHSFKNSLTNAVSNYFSLVTPFLVILESKFNRSFSDRVLRIKSNLILRHSNFPEDFYNAAHTDWGSSDPEIKTETLLYYVNDSDGDTFLFNEKPPADKLSIKNRVSPKKGKAILFDSDFLHAGQPPRISNERCVINFVFRR